MEGLGTAGGFKIIVQDTGDNGLPALQENTDKVIATAMDAVRTAVDPQPDMRGSAEYKRTLAAALVKRAISIAMLRARGERVEVSHIYA